MLFHQNISEVKTLVFCCLKAKEVKKNQHFFYLTTFYITMSCVFLPSVIYKITQKQIKYKLLFQRNWTRKWNWDCSCSQNKFGRNGSSLQNKKKKTIELLLRIFMWTLKFFHSFRYIHTVRKICIEHATIQSENIFLQVPLPWKFPWMLVTTKKVHMCKENPISLQMKLCVIKWNDAGKQHWTHEKREV